MIGRFKCENDVFYGEISGSLVHAKGKEGRTFELSKLEILPPTEPSKIVASGLITMTMHLS